MSSRGKRFLMGRLDFVVLAFSFVGVTCPPVRVRCEERVLRFDALVDASAV